MQTPAGWRKRNKKYNIEGHAHFLTFSCYRRLPLLTNELWREWLAAAIRTACQKYQIALWAYVFMPEHVHLLLKPRRARYDLARFEKALKLSVARKVLNALAAQRSPLIERLRIGEGFRFWQAGGGHDLNVWSMNKAIEKAQYCHRNPVLRKLVKSPEQWRWSSFRWIELGQRDHEPLPADEWDESLLEPDGAGTDLIQPRSVAPNPVRHGRCIGGGRVS